MIAAAANLAWLAAQSTAATRFRRQLHAPQAAQESVLRDLLQRNAASAFGRKYGFAAIRTTAEFSAQVPLSSYADLEPWIRRIMEGEKSVLTADEVTHLVPTSGSSGARKLIPFTAELQREFSRAINPWISDLFRQQPAALFGPAYWSVSPNASVAVREESVVPVGFEDDTRYLGGIHRRLVAATLAVPPVIRHVSDTETFLLLTVACLLQRRDLRLISVWHPSFLLLLLDALTRHWEPSLEIVRTGKLPTFLSVSAVSAASLGLVARPARARELRELGPEQPERLWPHLALLSCWTDAHAALSARVLAARFAQTPIQSKGLLATEAFVTLPFAGDHPLAIGSHYFEFIDDAGDLHPAGALQIGRVYEVVVTTGGGLWRYRLGDRVRVKGFVLHTPSLEFVGRNGEVSDLRGEKLSGGFVRSVIAKLHRHSPPRFAMLAPDADAMTASYTLFWEGDDPPSPAELDRNLSENPHYAWCRQLGQLRPARVFAIRAGAGEAYLHRMSSAGAKLGDLKPPTLTTITGWDTFFAGRFLS